jgi:hypothetical protein
LIFPDFLDMAIVINDAQEAIGIVTLEDVIEELIGEEIEDEMDLYRRDKYIERVRSSFDTRQRKSPQPSHVSGLDIPVVRTKHKHHHGASSSSHPHRHHHRHRSVGSSPNMRPSSSTNSLPQMDPELGLEVIDDEPHRRTSLDVPSTVERPSAKKISFAASDDEVIM